ncbi:MAG: metallophosphoesterase [Clostridia bacterium]|nr:metallophosphoesterase [Clostridia bacterium]
MNILIFSDSHGRGELIGEVLARQITPPDAVIFLGDGLRDLDRVDTGAAELYCVRGNCDFAAFGEEEEQTVILGGKRIFMTHGHLYGVKSGYGLAIAHAISRGADILLFGHTHEPYLQRIEKGSEVGGRILERELYVFNPGSLRDGRFGTMTVVGGQIILHSAEI